MCEFISFRPAAAKKKPNGRVAGRGTRAGLGWAGLDGTICRVVLLPCAAFLAASPWLLLSRRLFGFTSMTTCDLAQRLGDGAEMYRTVTCACLVVRLASVRSGRLWVASWVSSCWDSFREARVEGGLASPSTSLWSAAWHVGLSAAGTVAPWLCFCCGTVSHCAN